MPAIAFMKFVVADLDAMTTFYETAFGFEVGQVIDADHMTERVLDLSSGAALVLYHDKNLPAPEVGTAHGPLGINTTDVDGYYQRAIGAGATSKMAPFDYGPVRVAFVFDPEGHEIEIVDLSANPV